MPDGESLERTAATIILMLVWAAVVVAPMLFRHVQPPRYEIVVSITSIVFLILGRMWGIEVERVLDAITNITISTNGGRNDGDTEDD